MRTVNNCEAQGKGRAKGRPRKVTQMSFMDGGWWMVDILSLMLYIKFGCHPPPTTTTTNTGRLILLNSLLPVSRYINKALAEKGSHQKKTDNQNIQTHLSLDY